MLECVLMSRYRGPEQAMSKHCVHMCVLCHLLIVCPGSGDVKYHLGTSYDRPTASGKIVHMSLLANPSHLEAVNTVVLGKCRAKQFYADDHERTGTMPILLHGDGAFSGQVTPPPWTSHTVYSHAGLIQLD